MASAKQLAALKKGRESLAKKRKRKSPVKRKAAAKRKAPAKRKVSVKRKVTRRKTPRKAATKTGYQMIVKKGAKTIGWWNGHAWEDNAAHSKFFKDLNALKRDLGKAQKITGRQYGIAAEPVKKW